MGELEVRWFKLNRFLALHELVAKLSSNVQTTTFVQTDSVDGCTHTSTTTCTILCVCLLDSISTFLIMHYTKEKHTQWGLENWLVAWVGQSTLDAFMVSLVSQPKSHWLYELFSRLHSRKKLTMWFILCGQFRFGFVKKKMHAPTDTAGYVQWSPLGRKETHCFFVLNEW